MHKFVRNLLTEWRKLKLPFENKTFVVAVSGGADSVSLLLALHELQQAKKLRLNFLISHFNHDLRGEESRLDARFVEQLAKSLEFNFECGIPDPESRIQNHKGNLEQNARRARYAFLACTAEEHNACGILTAHTLNDQAETFLLNLIRGSGVRGLGAMKPVKNLTGNSGVLLIRPLLSWANRTDTENFALERQINFRRDAMNEDDKFARVRVRKKLIPLLQEFNPQIVETLAQTATLLQQENEYSSLNLYRLPENPEIKELKNLSKAKLYDSLRVWLEELCGNLRKVELKHIQAIENLIFSRKSGRMIELPSGGIVIKNQGKLFFERVKVEKRRGEN